MLDSGPPIGPLRENWPPSTPWFGFGSGSKIASAFISATLACFAFSSALAVGKTPIPTKCWPPVAVCTLSIFQDAWVNADIRTSLRGIVSGVPGKTYTVTEVPEYGFSSSTNAAISARSNERGASFCSNRTRANRSDSANREASAARALASAIPACAVSASTESRAASFVSCAICNSRASSIIFSSGRPIHSPANSAATPTATKNTATSWISLTQPSQYVAASTSTRSPYLLLTSGLLALWLSLRLWIRQRPSIGGSSPCGEGSGVGVVRCCRAVPHGSTPHPTLPHKGGGSPTPCPTRWRRRAPAWRRRRDRARASRRSRTGPPPSARSRARPCRRSSRSTLSIQVGWRCRTAPLPS
jgi:hypothetical protein